MQEKNVVANTYWADNERFADVMNVGMFQDKVLTAEQLSEKDGYLGLVNKEKVENTIQRNRDVTKKVAFGTNFVILSIENQSDIHYAMPVRVMGYEFMDYNRQLKDIRAIHEKKKDLYGAEYLSGFSKEDKLQPVCTLVIYYGKEPWTGPKRLSDMLDFKELPETVKGVVADYPIHIVDARRFENSEQLETDARLLFGVLKRDEDKDEWIRYVEENKQSFQHISSDTYHAIATFTKAGKLLGNEQNYISEEGDVDMCKALDDLIKDGEQRIKKLIECLVADGLSDAIPRIASEPDFCDEMLVKYNIE